MGDGIEEREGDCPVIAGHAGASSDRRRWTSAPILF
jgi:hypothetical protein